MTQPLAQLPAGAAEANSSPTISVSLEELPALATEVHHVAGEYRQSISPLQSAQRHGGTLTQVYIGQQASSSLAQVLRDLQWIEQDMEQTSKNVYANYAGYTDADQKNARDPAGRCRRRKRQPCRRHQVHRQLGDMRRARRSHTGRNAELRPDGLGHSSDNRRGLQDRSV